MVTQAQTKIGSTRKTKGYERTRKAAPGQFARFFTKSLPGGKKVVVGVKKGGTTKVQSVMKPRSQKEALERFARHMRRQGK